MTFSNIIAPDINYDFTSYNTLANWKTYADNIPNATYSLSDYNGSIDGVWLTSEQVGFFQIILPATHDYLEITWGNAHNPPGGQPTATTSLSINGTVVDSITNIVQSKQYLYHYTGTPTVRVSEGFSIMSANIIIKLVKKAIYTMTFQENTEVQLVVASNSFVRFINPFIQPSGVVNIIVGNAGGHSSYDTTSTSTETMPYFSFNSDISGSIVTYKKAIVIVRYKYKRPIIQAQLIDSNYKYISFLNNTGLNQISYLINFQEQTEVQLLLLDGLNYIETTPFLTNGIININVGVPSTFDTLTTTTNSTIYDIQYISSITGTSITYTDSVVIVRYKTTKTVITQINPYGFLKYNEDNVWEVSNELQTVINGLISRIQTLQDA